MNANITESSSLLGKMTAILVVVLLSLSSFTLLGSADSGDEQEIDITSGITLGEALEPSDEGVQAISELNTVYPGQDIPVATTMDVGKFGPAKAAAGEAKIMVVDDDGENWMSGPWIEASHVATALNDGGYSYDVFRAGRWGGTNLEIPNDLSILDDYEAIIWYSGWNTNIMTGTETGILEQYLDGDCDDSPGNFCTDNRNIIVMTQMSDWFDANNGQFQNSYMHSDTYYSSYIVVGGTSNPMKGVDDSIFEGKEYTTDSAGVHYLDRPCGNKAYDSSAIGAFWMDVHKGATHGHEYHAVQFPVSSYDDTVPGAQTHKAFMFADEIGVFNKRTDRADFMATILGWMDVTKEAKQNVDIGIGGVDIPNHVQYWRSVEANVALDIKITVTNYGLLPQSSTAVKLQMKNEFGQILFDSTFDTRAWDNFPNSPMHVADSIVSGDSIVFTFNQANDEIQRIYDDNDPSLAREVRFTSAGMNKLSAQVMHTGDQGSANNYVQADVGVGKWIENGEAPEDEIGDSITFGDTNDNGVNSLPYHNYHRASSYDTDADGCGWAVTTDADGNGIADCSEDPNSGTLNKTEGAVYHEGKSSLASFNTNGWYKTSSDGSCEWGSNSLDDSGCPKFTPEPYQDDFFISPVMDFTAMDEVVIGMLFSGCMESGDYFRMQIKREQDDDWTSLINYSNFCPGEGAWYLWGGGNPKYQGYVLDGSFVGSGDGNDRILFRVQMDADSDQTTEGSRPYMGWFIDEIVFRGTERITRDMAVSDITVDEDFLVHDNQGESLYREINATILNAGSQEWNNLGVKMSIRAKSGDDSANDNIDDKLSHTDFIVDTMPKYSTYGDVRPGMDGESQRDLFSLFRCEEANTYTVTVSVEAPRDFFPWNNTLSVEFRVFDTFFKDNIDEPASGETPSRSEVYSYTTVQRTSNGDNTWRTRGVDSNAYQGEYVWQYAKETGYDKNNPTTSGSSGASKPGSDDSLITQDQYDRDRAGEKFGPAENVDLRSAYDPILTFAIKWDLGAGDKLEVRAAKDFDSSTKLSSGTWTVLKTYTGSGGLPFLSSDKGTWVIEELTVDNSDIGDFEGYQTWFDFRVVTSSGGGKGVMIDELMVIGNEYRQNVGITDVTTERFTAAGLDNDLSVTVKGIGLNTMTQLKLKASITDTFGEEKWAAPDYSILSLAKGETVTVSPDSDAGKDWKWGAGMDPGIYTLKVEVIQPNQQDEGENWDEEMKDNVLTYTIVLGAALLSGDEWGTGDNMGDGWSAGSYVWDGTKDGTLTSDSFTIWNKKPFLIVEAEYELPDANVRAEVSVGSGGNWYPVKWRSAEQIETLYSIPGQPYTVLPDSWTGSSYGGDDSEMRSKHTFYADLGAIEMIGDGSGNLQDKYIGGSMQVRIDASSTCTGLGCVGGEFTAYYPSVFGLDDYSVDVKEINPPTANAEPSSATSATTVTKTFTVKTSNFGAASDSPVVDFVINAPDKTFVELWDGSMARLASIIQQGPNTLVAIAPVSQCWGAWDDTAKVCTGDRDSPDGGDSTAYINELGEISWPNGELPEVTNDPTNWKIGNPTKSNWDAGGAEKPKTPTTFVAPGEVSTTQINVDMGFAAWAPPGVYSVQADARSWVDYENTFTSGDSNGAASIIIARPDLSIGDNVRYISHATGFGESGTGWVKQTGCTTGSADTCENDPYFSFMVEVVNSGTETVGTFSVGLEDRFENPLGVSVPIYWSGNGWKIDETMANDYQGEIVKIGSKSYISFKATASELGMSAGPEDGLSQAYEFYISVDTGGLVSESNENNNRVPITITAVKEVNTVPSFGLSMISIAMSGLLAAIGIALRQKEEE